MLVKNDVLNIMKRVTEFVHVRRTLRNNAITLRGNVGVKAFQEIIINRFTVVVLK